MVKRYDLALTVESKGLNKKASNGMESEYTTEELSSKPKLGLRPKGIVHGP